MRAFSLLRVLSVGRRPRWAALWALGASITVAPEPADGQWPGELVVVVVDRLSARPLSDAFVELQPGARGAVTGGEGRARFMGLTPGPLRLHVRRVGYRPAERSLEARNGSRTTVVVVLDPDPLALDEIRVVVERASALDGTSISRARIESSGARTVGDVVDRVPGVVVRSTTRSGPASASIRGSDAGAVLVLLDGAPLNDPVTGEADLSAIPAGSVERVTVVPGGRAARFGAGARGGVIVIESRGTRPGLSAWAGVGSLGRRTGRVEGGLASGDRRWGLGVELDQADGAFDFDPVLGTGTTSRRRVNADARQWAVSASLDADWLGGEARARAGFEGIDRGLPGKVFTPSTTARQRLARARASLAWDRTAGTDRHNAVAYSTRQSVRFRDPDPPLGRAVDDRTRMSEWGIRYDGARTLTSPVLRALGVGADVRAQHVRSEALDPGAPPARTDGAIHTRAVLGPRPGEAGDAVWSVSLSARAHRDGAGGAWHGSHEVTLRTPAGPLSAHLAHRSAFSPPTLGDQFFQDGVGVEANPALRPERVPGEIELGLATRTTGPLPASAGVAVYAGDVRDLIVWQPDFRFVWSPRNTDVRRRGVSAWAEAELPRSGLAITADFTLARVTYDRPGDAEPVQVAYRPRRSGSLGGRWSGPSGHVELVARYVGTRNPVPAPTNPLPGFWSASLNAGWAYVQGRWTVRPRLHVDRLLGSTDSLIFGFPDPGRTMLLSVELTRGAPGASTASFATP